MPWEKKEDKKAPTYSTVAALAMYKVATPKEEMGGEAGVENIQFKRMWLKTFSKQIGCIHWCEAEQTVYVGFD